MVRAVKAAFREGLALKRIACADRVLDSGPGVLTAPLLTGAGRLSPSATFGFEIDHAALFGLWNFI